MPGFVDAPPRMDDYNEGEVPKSGKTYEAVLFAVGDIFERQDAQYNKTLHSLYFTWELIGALDSKGRNFRVNKRYNVQIVRDGGKDGPAKLDEHGKFQMLKPNMEPDTKQHLGIDMRSWGVPLPKSGRLEDLVGQKCQLFIKTSPREKGGFWANVESVDPVEGVSNAANASEGPLPF